jgi:hypothetical protein
MNGHPTDKPLASYAILIAVWTGAFGGALTALRRRLPRGLSLSDLLLVGTATHKLSRTITRDRVTAPVRAPFTAEAGTSPTGEVKEKARGHGLQRAIGDLITCPYCTGPWVAGALVCGLVAAPRPTRLFAGLFTAVTISDFIRQAYQATVDGTRALASADRR